MSTGHPFSHHDPRASDIPMGRTWSNSWASTFDLGRLGCGRVNRALARARYQGQYTGLIGLSTQKVIVALSVACPSVIT